MPRVLTNFTLLVPPLHGRAAYDTRRPHIWGATSATPERRLNDIVRLVVHGRSSLIEQQHARLPQECPRQANQLPLPCRQALPVLCYRLQQTIREASEGARREDNGRSMAIRKGSHKGIECYATHHHRRVAETWQKAKARARYRMSRGTPSLPPNILDCQHTCQCWAWRI